MASFIKVNGIDLSAIGITIDRIDGLSPLAPMRFDRSRGALQQEIESRHVTINLLVQSATTITALHSYVDTLASYVGANGLTRREVSVEFLDGSTVIHLLHVIVEAFDVDYIDPQSAQLFARVSMRCLVVSSANPAGRTSGSFTLSGNALGFQHRTIIDSSNGQSASRLTMRMTPSVSGTLGVYSLASENDFLFAHSASTAGSIAIVDGLYGLPAMKVTANATYARYLIPFALPIYGSNYVTAVIRFKRNYILADATAKYLLDEGSQFRVSIDASTGQLRFTGTGTAVTLSGATVSDTQWNTLIVTVSGATATMYLYTPGVGLTSASQTNWTTFSTTNLWFYIGNSTAGTNPCQSSIAEVAIYKYPLSATVVAEVAALAAPIRDTRKLDISRHLTFLLDFSNGFSAYANRYSGFTIQNQITSSETLLLDFDRLLAQKINRTSGIKTDINNEMNFIASVKQQIALGTVNCLLFYVPTSGTMPVNYSYDAGRYR